MASFDQSGEPRVLVVDDLPENIILLRRLLKPKGYQILEAHDGVEAMNTIAETLPDVVLLDLVMPEMDGFEVCKRIKRNPGTSHVPVIIITGMAEHDANLKALQLGADDFVTRPIDPSLLEARIRSSVRAKTMQDQIIRYKAQLEVDNQELEERVRDRTRQLELSQQVTVFSLAKLAESRDPETGQHLERIRRYVREVAFEMASEPRLADEVHSGFVQEIYYASPLHDVGKVGIPDRILLKPGKLTDTEFEAMKLHATIGGQTLEAADREAGGHPLLAMGRDIAYTHHEKWDGSGYPRGLGGKEIPLAGRIVALGDVYDALRSRRPYKEPFSHERARDIIVEGRGQHFDPDVVDAFMARENRFVEIHTAVQDHDIVSPLQRVIELLGDEPPVML